MATLRKHGVHLVITFLLVIIVVLRLIVHIREDRLTQANRSKNKQVEDANNK